MGSPFSIAYLSALGFLCGFEHCRMALEIHCKVVWLYNTSQAHGKEAIETMMEDRKDGEEGSRSTVIK
jgi:hypothetical protein